MSYAKLHRQAGETSGVDDVPPRSPLPVVFLAGAARSGGTLVEFVLARRFGFFPVGELIYVWERGYGENQLCSCGSPFLECPFWRAVTDDAFGENAFSEAMRARALQRTLLRTRAVPRILRAASGTGGFATQVREYRDVLAQLYRSVGRISGADVIVDSSRSGAYGLILEGVSAIDLRVVHLIRDSRAYAHSRTRVRSRPEIHWTHAQMLRTGAAVSAREWVRLNLLAEILCRRGPAASRLRYEDFAVDPESALEPVGAMSDAFVLPGDTTPKWLESVGYHAVSGNPIRFELSEPDIRLDDEWLRAMDRRNRLLVGSLTLPLLVRYGYVPRSPYR
jgi:hypothetical protein